MKSAFIPTLGTCLALLSVFASACAQKHEEFESSSGNQASKSLQEQQDAKGCTETYEANARKELVYLTDVMGLNGFDFSPQEDLLRAIKRGGLRLLWTTWDEGSKYRILSRYAEVQSQFHETCANPSDATYSDYFYSNVKERNAVELGYLAKKFGGVVPPEKKVIWRGTLPFCSLQGTAIQVGGKFFYNPDSPNEMLAFLNSMLKSGRCISESGKCEIDGERLLWNGQTITTDGVTGVLRYYLHTLQNQGFCLQ